MGDGAFERPIPPIPSNDGLISEVQTGAVLESLRTEGSAIPHHVTDLVHLVMAELLANYEEIPPGSDEATEVTVSLGFLHAVMARVARRSAAQTVTDIRSPAEIERRMLEKQIGLPSLEEGPEDKVA